MQIIIKTFAKLLATTYKKYIQSLQQPQKSQNKIQNKLLKNLEKSNYSKSFNLTKPITWEEIPIVEYQDIEKFILDKSLTTEEIIFYEKTSGSRSAVKRIPYTKSLRHSFNQMFCIWAYDLITYGPKLSTGKIYFCISPKFKEVESEKSGIAGNDSEYLDHWLRWILSPFLVSPPDIEKIKDPEEFKHQLALTLIVEEKLETISIWSPSFLKVILDYINTNSEILGSQLKNKISSQRYQILTTKPIDYKKLWSSLKLISCWDRANAADAADFLRSLFPRTLIQGKGLLATEAPMTIPLINAKGCLPLLNEVFFEFQDESGKIYLIHEITQGEIYELIISQKGGLYRYRIGDRIRVTHFYFNTPCLEFIGRSKDISDLVGEKLNSNFVGDVVDSLGISNASYKSLISVNQEKPHYILLLDKTNQASAEIVEKLDRALKKSPQYHRARLLGQLHPPRVLVSHQILEVITSFNASHGKKWGDFKHEILPTKPIEEGLLTELEKICN